jgi:hypothetical protein
MTSRTRQAAQQLVEDLAEQLASEARSRAPRGKTGRLQKSIVAFETKANKRTGELARSGYDTKDSIRYVVRPTMWKSRTEDYAYNVEFGQLPRSRKVQSYSRRLRSRDVRGWAENRHGRRRRKIIATGLQLVKGYTSRQTMKASPYLGPAFEAMRSQIENALTTGLRNIVTRTESGMDAGGGA